MNRPQFEHIVASASEVTGIDEFVVIGSQAILGPYPDAPEQMLRSMEADIYPRDAPERMDEVEGALGDGSDFARMNGYYAHGVGPETATPPLGWQTRLVRVLVPPRVTSQARPVAWCLVPGAWCLVPGAWCLVPGAWNRMILFWPSWRPDGTRTGTTRRWPSRPDL
jgi:hypothetical protein